jgi:hypothetical protein
MRRKLSGGLQAACVLFSVLVLALAAGCGGQNRPTPVAAINNPTTVQAQPAIQNKGKKVHFVGRRAHDTTVRPLFFGVDHDFGTLLWVPAGGQDQLSWSTDCNGNCGAGTGSWQNPGGVGIHDAFFPALNSQTTTDTVTQVSGLTQGKTYNEKIAISWAGGNGSEVNSWEFYAGTPPPATPAPITVTPGSISFTTIGQIGTVNINEPGFTGSFTLQSSPNPSVAIVTAIGTAGATLKSTGVGSTSFSVVGAPGSLSQPVPITVTTPGPIFVSRGSQGFQGVGQTLPINPIMISEANYPGTFNVRVDDPTVVTPNLAGRNLTLTSVGPGNTTVYVGNQWGTTPAKITVTVKMPDVVRLYPNDELDFPIAGNELGNCQPNQPHDPFGSTSTGTSDPDGISVPDSVLNIDNNGCETLTTSLGVTRKVDQFGDPVVHIHETGFYGVFTISVTGGDCGDALSNMSLSSPTGPDAMVKMHGTTNPTTSLPASCTVQVQGWKQNPLSNVRVMVKMGASP